MTQVLITLPRATLEQLVGALKTALDVATHPSDRRVIDATNLAGRAALAGAEPVNSYDLAKRADNWGQP